MCKECKGTHKITLLTSVIECKCIDWQAKINKTVEDVKASNRLKGTK